MRLYNHSTRLIGLLALNSLLFGCQPKPKQAEKAGFIQTTSTYNTPRRNNSTYYYGQQDTYKAPNPMMASDIKGEMKLVRTGYTISYNPQNRQPNYVSWVLNARRTRGRAKRQMFTEDPTLKSNIRSTLDDYRSSGYDRGHLCPAGDNKWSDQAMNETFYLSNICPQRHTLNSGDWRILEEACREWVQRTGESYYIVAGPIFNTPGKYTRVLRRHVPVPDRFFKLLICLDKGKEKGIAFVFNNNTEEHKLNYYVTTIDEVERITGYNFYHSLNGQLQQQLESQHDFSQWGK